MKKNLIVFVLLTIIVCCFILLKNTWAFDNSNDNLNLSLEYNNDINVFKNNAKDYIDLIDNSLFESYKYDSLVPLNEDYNFITNFAISFILNNVDFYKNTIEIGKYYTYKDSKGNLYKTNKYVNLNIIYDITYHVFGIRNYSILNDSLIVDENMIPLLLVDYNNSKMVIDSIDNVVHDGNFYYIYVLYKNLDYKYVYKFNLINNRLNLVNLDIEV